MSEYIFSDPFIQTPEGEFENFCKNRLESLALTSGEEALEDYRCAINLGLERLGKKNEEEKA